MAKYVYNYPGMPEGAKAVLHHLKLDIVSCCNFSWREAHNKMLLRSSVALDNLKNTLPPIDEDQRLALLHAPLKGTTLFRGELAKLQEANTKRAATFTVFPTPIAPLSLTLLIGGAREGLVAGAEDRTGPCHPPLLLNLGSLKRVRRP